MNVLPPLAGAVIAAAASTIGMSPALAQQAPRQFPSFDAVDADLDGDGTISRQEWSDWRDQRMAGAAAPTAREPAEGAELPSQIQASVTDEIIEGKYIRDANLIGLDGNSIAFAALFSDDRDIVLSSELMAPGLIEQWLPPFLSISLGGKLYLGLLDDPDDDNFAIAPGVEGRVDLPLDVPMAVVGRLFYSPDILSFGDSDTVIEFDTRFEVRFLPQTTGFVGYRVLNFEREAGGEDKIVNGIHAGLRFAF